MPVVCRLCVVSALEKRDDVLVSRCGGENGWNMYAIWMEYVCLEYELNIYGIWMGQVWTAHGIRIDYERTVYGTWMEYDRIVWNMLGICTEYE